MSTIENFLAYAGDFELTYIDDNWQRLEKYFADDAIYVVSSQVVGCELRGTQSIFAGMKKSLDGFDRNFQERKITPHDDMQVTDTSLSLGWTVGYSLPGYPTFNLVGRSEVTYKHGIIARLEDSFTAEAEQAMGAWLKETGLPLDVSYT